MGVDGTGLSCPGSSVVVEIHQGTSTSGPLIKSLDEDLSQDTQRNESSAKEEDS